MNERNPVSSEQPAVGTGGQTDQGAGWDGSPDGSGTRACQGRQAKRAERRGLSPEGTFCKHVCGSLIQQSPEDQAGAEREHATPVRRGADGAIGARAEPAPAWALSRGGDTAQTAAPHAQEPRLRGQLSREARVPKGGAAEAEVGAGARGGQAGARERRHAPGARRAARQVRGAAGLRALRRRLPRALRARGSRQRHHHRQVGSESWPGPCPWPCPCCLLLVPSAPDHAPFPKPLPSDPSSRPEVPKRKLCPQVPFLCSHQPLWLSQVLSLDLSSLCGLRNWDLISLGRGNFGEIGGRLGLGSRVSLG